MLKDIIKLLAGALGRNPDDASDYAYLRNLANRSAKELYESSDIAYSLFEEPMNFTGREAMIITLPARVGRVRGLRWAPANYKVELSHLGLRYHNSSESQTWRLAFRDLVPTPLHTELSNESTLLLRPIGPLKSDVNITIVGPTPYAERVIETVTLKAGTLDGINATNVVTENNFNSPESIIKNGFTSCDIGVYDADGTEISRIPNNAYETEYKRIQVGESSMGYSSSDTTALIEVFYKRAFFPLIDNYDTFLGVNKWDDVIFYNALMFHYSDDTSSEGYSGAKTSKLSAQTAVQNDYEQSQRKLMDYAPNKNLEAQTENALNYYTRGLQYNG